MKLDVVVTDGAGHAIGGLARQDFTLLDNQAPQPILLFRASDSSAAADRVSAAEIHPDPPTEVILLVDMANASFRDVATVRYQLDAFLRRDGGHLGQPITLMVFTDQGVKVQPRPSRDGQEVSRAFDQIETALHIVPLTRGYDAVDRTTLSLKTLGQIAAFEGSKPGRKMLVWIGPGWPMLEGGAYQFSGKDRHSLFDTIVSVTRELREARVTLYSVYPRQPGTLSERAEYYKEFLKPVRSAKDADPGDLALPVLAVHSGGKALDLSGDLGGELEACLADAGGYYTLGFDPPPAEKADEYHELAVRVDRPGLAARTRAGYYGLPTP